MAGAAQARRSRTGGPGEEARLARAAGGGDLRAFSRLYERHENEAFNLAFRIMGSRDDAAEITRDAFIDALQALTHLGEGAPPFATCLMIATRNAAHERSEQGTPPQGWQEAEGGEDGGHPALDVLQAEVAQANFALPGDAREAIALAEMDAMSYGEIATVMDLDPDSVPSVIADARMSLHDELFDTDLAGGSRAEDCDQALTLAAMRDDGQIEDEEEFEWLLDHLAHCADCRVHLDAMGEAAADYRRWERAKPPSGLYRETMVAAVQLIGAGDPIPQRAPRRGRGLAAAAHGGTRHLGATIGNVATAAAGALQTLRGRASALAAERQRRLPQHNLMVTAGLLVLVLGGLAAMAAGVTVLMRDDDGADEAAPPAAAQATQPSTPARAPVKEKKKKRRPKARQAVKAPVPVAPQRLVVIQPQVRSQTPQATPRRPAPQPKKKRTSAPRRPRGEITPAPAPVPAPTPAPPVNRTPAPSDPPAVPPAQPGPPQCNGDTPPC